MNGGAAYQAKPGDVCLIMAFSYVKEGETARPKTVIIGEGNRLWGQTTVIWHQDICVGPVETLCRLKGGKRKCSATVACPRPSFREIISCQRVPRFPITAGVSRCPINAIAFLGHLYRKDGNCSLRSLSLNSMIIGSLFTGPLRKCSIISPAPAMTSIGSRYR